MAPLRAKVGFRTVLVTKLLTDDELYRLSCLHFIVESRQLPDGCDSNRFKIDGLIEPVGEGWRLTPLGTHVVKYLEERTRTSHAPC